MCGCECCISAKSIYYYFLTWYDFNLKQLKDRIHNAQIRRSGEISSRIFETYRNEVRSQGLLDVQLRLQNKLYAFKGRV